MVRHYTPNKSIQLHTFQTTSNSECRANRAFCFPARQVFFFVPTLPLLAINLPPPQFKLSNKHTEQHRRSTGGHSNMAPTGEIVVVPFPHPGHIFPATELSRRLADRNIHVTIILPSTSSPSTLFLHPLITPLEFPLPHPTRFPPGHLEETLPHLLTQFISGHKLVQCVIIDEMISWLFDTPKKLNIPAVAFFTSSAYTETVDHAARGGGHHGHHGPRRPRGVAGTTGAAALLFNTCEELDGQSLQKIAMAVNKPVLGVGPLLPAKLSADVRPRSSVSETGVLAWLDACLLGTVVYVSFGTLVVPSDDELAELAAGLAESGRPFIWVVQAEARAHSTTGEPLQINGSSASEAKCGAASGGEMVPGNGMIIRGWAPQLAILGHEAVGAFVCHCGWNSTVEALASGVPVLAWPVRGDQFDNAELITSRLGAGCAVRAAEGETVTRRDVVRGIERVMGDDEIKKRAAAAREVFAGGIPVSSAATLDKFLEFVTADGAEN